MINGFIKILLGVTSFISFNSTNPQISIHKVTPEGGVTYSQVTSIIEDDNGFIWFSTYNGLFHYNSIEIKKYSYSQNDPFSISANRINQLFKDSQGKIWVATQNGLCVYDPKKDNFERYTIRSQFDNYIGNNITSFFQDENKNYWFTDENGIGTINLKNKRAVYKNISNKTSTIIYATINSDNTIWVFFEDGDIYFRHKESNSFQFFGKGLKNTIRTVLFDNDLIWIGYSTEGILCLDNKNAKEVHKFTSSSKTVSSKLPSNQVRSLIKDDNNQIWAATFEGIAIINNKKVVDIVNKEKYSEIPFHSIWNLYKDSQQNIWIGTWMGGLAFHSKYNKSFQHYKHSSSKKSLSNNIVSCFAQLPDKNDLLIGTDDGDINLFNPEKNEFSIKYIVYEKDTIQNIKSLAYDENETLWIGTYGNGVLYKTKSEKKFKRLTPPFETGFQAFDILPVKDGVWVSDYPLGVYHYNYTSKLFTRYQHNPLDVKSISNNRIKDIIQDKDENLWFATENGLNFLKKGSSQFKHLFYQELNPKSISFNHINCLYIDKNDYLWLGTNGQGLNKLDPKTGNSKHYTFNKGLQGNEVFSILEDQNQNLWITTENGVCKLNTQTDEIQFFNKDNSIGNNHFYPKAALASRNGELYFGGSNGIIRFSPYQIEKNPIPPKVTIIQLLINNQKISPKSENGILKDNIENTQSLKLNYKQNYISFLFASSNYISPQKTEFKYRLVNFSNQWINNDFNGKAYFTNVPPGKYIFEVKAANNDGIWNEIPSRIFIEITPPFWLTWYAYLFYCLLFITSIYFFRRQVINKQKLKSEIEMGKIVKETEKKLYQMKLQFFTNISHEFRTPLTLIQGPVNRLIKAGTNNDISNKQLTLIKNNTDRLLRLINQFLDFRRVDHSKLKLTTMHTDIIAFCKNVFDCFEEHANHRDIKFNFLSNKSNLNMDFDTDKLDKVLVNLISNAFKYSPDNSSIVLQIKYNEKTKRNQDWSHHSIGDNLYEDFVEISISDSGYGVPTEQLPQIFERFFQIEENNNSGTGIGLSLSTNYISLHKGQLLVSSSEGNGTVFYIYLPIHQKGTTHKKFKSELKPYISEFTSEPILDSVNYSKDAENQDSLILIVEDNPELLEFLSDSLNTHYKVAKSKNGKEAYDLALSLNPDLIISDIMMAKMNGVELCHKIKNDINTSHIPFILLTALDSVQDKISGIDSGADAYIPKPFSEDFLIVRINNLLHSRKMLRNLFSSQMKEWNEHPNVLNLDKRLLLKAIKIIEENITNSEFSIEDLANNLNLSRSHLHRKLKSLTNQSASEFIRSIRLKNAINLMKEGDLMIKEIGYAVGFNSHNYFTKAFKKQYGITPSEFVKENKSSLRKT